MPIDLLPWGLLLILGVLYAASIGILLTLGRRRDARAVAGFIPDCLRMLRRLLADPETSTAQRLALLGLIIYLASPIDLVPDSFLASASSTMRSSSPR